MKRFWRLLTGLAVASSFLLAPAVVNAFARPLPLPQDHGHGQENEEHGHGKKEHRHQKENRGQRKKWERDQRGYYRFDNSDRRLVTDYYRDHRYAYERERIPRGLHLGWGTVLEPRYRPYCHPVPVALVEELPPPPEGFRYYLFDGNVVLLDDGYRVHDFIRLEFNFGR